MLWKFLVILLLLSSESSAVSLLRQYQDAPTTLIAPRNTPAPLTNCDGVGTLICPVGTCYTGNNGYIGCCSTTSCEVRTTCYDYTDTRAFQCDINYGGCIGCGDSEYPSCAYFTNTFMHQYAVSCNSVAGTTTVGYQNLVTSGPTAATPVSAASSNLPALTQAPTHSGTAASPSGSTSQAISSQGVGGQTGSSSSSPSSTNSNSNLSAGAIAAISASSAIALVILVFLVCCIRFKWYTRFQGWLAYKSGNHEGSPVADRGTEIRGEKTGIPGHTRDVSRSTQQAETQPLHPAGWRGSVELGNEERPMPQLPTQEEYRYYYNEEPYLGRQSPLPRIGVQQNPRSTAPYLTSNLPWSPATLSSLNTEVTTTTTNESSTHRYVSPPESGFGSGPNSAGLVSPPTSGGSRPSGRSSSGNWHARSDELFLPARETRESSGDTQTVELSIQTSDTARLRPAEVPLPESPHLQPQEENGEISARGSSAYVSPEYALRYGI